MKLGVIIVKYPALKRKYAPGRGGIASAENFAKDGERALLTILGSRPDQKNARRVEK